MNKKQWPIVIGHRGAAGYAPENTIESMVMAQEVGATWIEFDVAQSACKELVVIHDDTLDRTTDRKGKVIDHRYQEIARLDAGSWFDESFSNVRIPTLTELIDCCCANSLSAVIEIKACGTNNADMAIMVSNIVKENWPHEKLDCIVSSFSLEILRTVRAQLPKQPLGLGIHKWGCDWERYVDELDCTSIHVKQEILTENKVAQLKKKEKALFAYTVNDVEHASMLFDWGVDGVFSDFPDKILALRI